MVALKMKKETKTAAVANIHKAALNLAFEVMEDGEKSGRSLLRFDSGSDFRHDSQPGRWEGREERWSTDVTRIRE